MAPGATGVNRSEDEDDYSTPTQRRIPTTPTSSASSSHPGRLAADVANSRRSQQIAIDEEIARNLQEDEYRITQSQESYGHSTPTQQKIPTTSTSSASSSRPLQSVAGLADSRRNQKISIDEEIATTLQEEENRQSKMNESRKSDGFANLEPVHNHQQFITSHHDSQQRMAASYTLPPPPHPGASRYGRSIHPSELAANGYPRNGTSQGRMVASSTIPPPPRPGASLGNTGLLPSQVTTDLYSTNSTSQGRMISATLPPPPHPGSSRDGPSLHPSELAMNRYPRNSTSQGRMISATLPPPPHPGSSRDGPSLHPSELAMNRDPRISTSQQNMPPVGIFPLPRRSGASHHSSSLSPSNLAMDRHPRDSTSQQRLPPVGIFPPPRRPGAAPSGPSRLPSELAGRGYPTTTTSQGRMISDRLPPPPHPGASRDGPSLFPHELGQRNSAEEPRKLGEADVTQSRQSKKRKASSEASKFKPKRLKGYKGFDRSQVDTKNAVVGQQNISKLLINFDAKKYNEETGEFLGEAARVFHDYRTIHPDFDFNDASQVKCLNGWRQQIFHRSFPKGRPAPPPPPPPAPPRPEIVGAIEEDDLDIESVYEDSN